MNGCGKAEHEEPESEFGKGLTYCLGMFLAHAEGARRFRDMFKEHSLVKEWPGLWFNGASDHLYDLCFPASLSEPLRDRLNTFQTKVLTWGHGYKEPEAATEEDAYWSINEAKELLRLIDEEFGVKTIVATWG